jgi:hypothetical protein
VRATLLALAILGLCGEVSAQVPAQNMSSLRASIVEGRSRAGLDAVTIPYATGGPWAAVPARPLAAVPPTVSDFRIRAWAEGTSARILVFAVAPRPDGTEAETQIASIALAPGESQAITATEKYNARPVTISVSRDR